MSQASVFAIDGSIVQIVRDRAVTDVGFDHPDAAGAPRVPPPPGDELARIATISDLHIGEPWFGVFPKVREGGRHGHDHYTVRAARAAIREAAAWGAELIVLKGDITWNARPGQWALATAVLAESPVPVVACVGNHDVARTGQAARPWLEDAGVKVIVDHDEPAAAVDVVGMRIVVGDTTAGYHGGGVVPTKVREQLATLVAEAPARRSLVVLHHYPNHFPTTTRYPPGIHHVDAVPLFAALREAGPPTLLTTGHTHRHRRYRRSGIDISEVGSTKDFPGVWAGYVVHEGGLRQVVRRIADPSVVAWTDRTARSCLGAWGWWTPGRLRWRCFSLPWR